MVPFRIPSPRSIRGDPVVCADEPVAGQEKLNAARTNRGDRRGADARRQGYLGLVAPPGQQEPDQYRFQVVLTFDCLHSAPRARSLVRLM